MAHFMYYTSCHIYPKEWQKLFEYVRDEWPSSYAAGLGDLNHQIEVKALSVFTIARRLVRAAYRLAGRTRRTEKGDWKPIFAEATSLLFPMIELVGHARLDDGQARTAYGKQTNEEVPSVANLWAGLHWLHDSANLPQVKNDLLKYDTDKLDKWEIGHLISLRNYYLHGSKSAKNRKGKQIPISSIMSYEIPRVIAGRAQEALPKYWRQLKEDDGNQEWVERLARADIRPFQIQGSPFEAGLIDRDIVDYLEGRIDTFGDALE
jgi:hypothetical protein